MSARTIGKRKETWVTGELLPKYMSRHVAIDRKRQEMERRCLDRKEHGTVYWRGGGDEVVSLLATPHPEMMEKVLHFDEQNGRRWVSKRIEGGIQYWLQDQFEKEPPPLHPSEKDYFLYLMNQTWKGKAVH